MSSKKSTKLAKQTKSQFYQIKKYFKIIDKKNNVIQCNLCPHNCVIQNNKIGLCKTRKNINGKFYSLVYGRPCAIHVDPVEKKPLYHFMPGKDVLSIGTFGCNLFCKGCQNYEIARADVENNILNLKYYTPKEIVDVALKDNIKMIAYTYNEPTVFFEYMLDIAKLAKKHKIKNVIVSNGYINKEPLKELCKYINAANVDIKGITKEFYRDYAKVKVEPILESIKQIHDAGVWLELTNLIIPTLNDAPEEIKELCRWIKENIGSDVPLHFSRFYPYYELEALPATAINTLTNAENIAKQIGLNYIYIGNIGKEENTYCKNKMCRNILIERPNYSGNIIGLSGKNNNQCKNCKTILDGVFK